MLVNALTLADALNLDFTPPMTFLPWSSPLPAPDHVFANTDFFSPNAHTTVMGCVSGM
jgi:hypothetical protein